MIQAINAGFFISIETKPRMVYHLALMLACILGAWIVFLVAWNGLRMSLLVVWYLITGRIQIHRNMPLDDMPDDFISDWREAMNNKDKQ